MEQLSQSLGDGHGAHRSRPGRFTRSSRVARLPHVGAAQLCQLQQHQDVDAYPFQVSAGSLAVTLWWVQTGIARGRFLKELDGHIYQRAVADGAPVVLQFPTLPACPGPLPLHCHGDLLLGLDLEGFFRKLRNLRPGRACRADTCQTLLAGWNFLEDLGYSLGLPRQGRVARSGALGRAYHRLFWGCPQPRGVARQPLPCLDREEVHDLREALGLAWAAICEQAPELEAFAPVVPGVQRRHS